MVRLERGDGQSEGLKALAGRVLVCCGVMAQEGV